MSPTAHLVQMFDSTIVRAHVSAAGSKGARKPGARAFRGGFSTKIHLKTDFDGLPIAFHLTGGPSQRQPQFRDAARYRPRHSPRRRLPTKATTRSQPTSGSRPAYLSSHSVSKEHRRETSLLSEGSLQGSRSNRKAVGKVKRFKRIALRCEKTAKTSPLSSHSLRNHLDQIRPHGLALQLRMFRSLNPWVTMIRRSWIQEHRLRRRLSFGRRRCEM